MFFELLVVSVFDIKPKDWCFWLLKQLQNLLPTRYGARILKQHKPVSSGLFSFDGQTLGRDIIENQNMDNTYLKTLEDEPVSFVKFSVLL